ncbi:protein kinase [Scytonema sp. UIC 10036]|uniref:serine/threonine-protein kinase n=1 Tax=Scytonema sp. UIC 10036 TaxID=2304196 RepID=UPI0012DAD745|nr:serine/threonine-protein kinase [Scytonema sp. UIC 10036]MUG98361.1 protein kinase [Scytonema sp. UIC 10036]
MCDYLRSTHKFFQSSEDNSDFLSQHNSLLNNRYRILKVITTGKFSQAFLAVDNESPSEDQSYLIKQFFAKPHAIRDREKVKELFHQESLLLALFSKHSQIPKFINSFEQDEQLYLVQEWIDGQSLEAELAQKGVFNEAEIRQLLRQLLPVLQFIHDHQVIHRDIKPTNVIRRRNNGQLVLVDFGAAKYARNKILEKTGTLIGSLEYAAPEQVKGKAVFASDLYSLGVTCLHLLTQMSPFDLYDCSEDAWIWRSCLPFPISPSLEQILRKLLQKPIKQRYASAAEVLADLNDLPKRILFPSKPSAKASTDDDDFETPYFGFSFQENLLAC